MSKYAGIYEGLYRVRKNGVDENGVFKSDTSYVYSISVRDSGPNTIVIEKGPFNLYDIVVDSADRFAVDSSSFQFEGWFSADSIYLRHKSLSGSQTPPYWFTNTEISFSGRKVY